MTAWWFLFDCLKKNILKMFVIAAVVSTELRRTSDWTIWITELSICSVGRTHSIVRLQTWNRRKDHGTEDFGGFVYVLDRFPQRDLGLWVFVCPTNNTLFCLYFLSLFLCLSFRLPRRGLSRPFLTTTGYHACVYIPVTTPELSRSTNTRTSGYHTRY